MEDGQTIYEVLRDARCAKGMTQSRLAELAGCRQSAISMFEGGRADVLSQKTLAAIAEHLGLDPKLLSARDQRSITARSLAVKYCPVAGCPSNIPYVVRGKLAFVPTMVEAPASEATRCALCGDVLENRCPNAECRADLEPGAFCRQCGTAFVTGVDDHSDAVAWSAEARAAISELRRMSETERFARRRQGAASREADRV